MFEDQVVKIVNDGLAKLIQFMDKHLSKYSLEDWWAKFEDFEDYSRDSDQSVKSFIDNFDQK